MQAQFLSTIVLWVSQNHAKLYMRWWITLLFQRKNLNIQRLNKTVKGTRWIVGWVWILVQYMLLHSSKPEEHLESLSHFPLIPSKMFQVINTNFKHNVLFCEVESKSSNENSKVSEGVIRKKRHWMVYTIIMCKCEDSKSQKIKLSTFFFHNDNQKFTKSLCLSYTTEFIHRWNVILHSQTVGE